MTPAQWDAHESAMCSTCVYDRSGRRACPIKAVMRDNPEDEQANKLFRRLSRCSQYSKRPEPKPKKNQTVKRKGERWNHQSRSTR